MRKKILFQVRDMYVKWYSSINLRNKGGNGFSRVVGNVAIKADLPSIKEKFHPLTCHEGTEGE
jgi:hypothetical protein